MYGVKTIEKALVSLELCCKIRVIERKYTKGPQSLFELKRVSSYRDSSNRESFMRVY